MLVSGIVAFYLATGIFTGKSYKKRHNRMFSITALASGLWSIGYSGMFLTDQDTVFLVFRAIGMTGLFLFLIACQIMLLIIAEREIKLFGFILVEAIIGVAILIGVINPDCVNIIHTENGLITEFYDRTHSLIYTIYTVAVAICYTIICVSITKNGKKKRIKEFGRRLLVVEAIIVAGMIVDTVLPAFGINYNIPASTILQFVGLELIHKAVQMINRNRISIKNMSGYIYHSLKTPVLIFDTENKLEVYNNEAKGLFDFLDRREEGYDFWKEEFNLSAPTIDENAHETIIIDAIYEKKAMNCKIYIDPIHDDYDDYLGYIVTINDITEMVNNMKELEQTKNEALSANQAKSLFLANMSHEIRTPMNSILGFSEIALKDDITPSTREYFEDIHNSASILLATINEILNISKIESGKMELVCDEYYPARMFKDVFLIVGMQAKKKNLIFETEISPNFPLKLYGDKQKISEILINILNNSVKYTNEGRVSIKADFVPGPEAEGVVRFEISDTGIGIKEEKIDTIFNTFQREDLTTNSNTEGTGLGLSITKGYIDIMGGDISVQSTYGTGSVFVVTIRQKVLDATPIKQENAAKSEELKQLKFRDVKVLAVDDNRVNLKVISKAMARYGLNIDVVSSGMASIEQCKNNEYDIVFMDQMMPEMDGVEAMKCIRELGNGYERGGKRKIIALTANAIEGTRENLIQEGFDDYLGKPIEFKIMEKVLTDILSEDKYYYE